MPYFTTTDDCRLFFVTKGDAPGKAVMVFLNGTAQTAMNWYSLAVRMQDRFRVIMYDARAQGRSDPGDRPLSLACHVKDLADLLDYLNVPTACLIGVSHGAHLGLAFAARFPGRVSRMAACGIGAQFDSVTRIIVRTWRQVLAAGGLDALAWAMLPWVFGPHFLSANKKMLDMIVNAIVKRNCRESLAAHLAALQTYPSPAAAAMGLSIPALVISSSEDLLVSRENAEALARLCSGSHLHFSRAGHSVPMEAPEWFETVVTDFFKPALSEASDAVARTRSF